MTSRTPGTGVPRFRPSRAGIIHLWDYIDEEFVFADGRLVLRGHNGSGKTKALEVLFPFVLDGQIDARRLDPFSGQGRTMKDNLLYQGQDAARGYVWMEFLRSTPDGPLTLTLVIGLQAHRQWARPTLAFYVTDQRIGMDFGLITADGKPIAAKTLRSVLGGDAKYKDGLAYRTEVASRLFGLNIARYTQLLDLLLALRRPMLAKDLDPAKVATTLSAGLSPVDDELIELAAGDFENLSAVQTEYDNLVTANNAVHTFLDIYTSYLKTIARDQLDTVADRLNGAAQRTDQLADAERTRAKASLAETTARDAAKDRDLSITAVDTRVKVLSEDKALTSHAELSRRRLNLAQDAKRIAENDRRIVLSLRNINELRSEAERTDHTLAQERLAEAGDLTEIQQSVQQAALPADDSFDTGTDFLPAAKALAAARTVEIGEVRELLGDVGQATRTLKDAQDNAAKLQQEQDLCAEKLTSASQRTVRTRSDAVAHLTGWNQRWHPTGLTGDTDTQALMELVQDIDHGTGDDLKNLFTQLTEERRLAAAVQLADLTRERDLAAANIGEREQERERIAQQRDDAPAHNDTRPADRTGRPGAPLWQLVRFADHVPPAVAAGIEGGLHAAGLLTAWVHPTSEQTHKALAALEADGYLLPLPHAQRPTGATLLDFLVAEEHDEVTAESVHAVLASIAVAGTTAEWSGPTAVTKQSQFNAGTLAGALPKAAAEFIGATNRARRRSARIAELTTLIEQLTTGLAHLEQSVLAATEASALYGKARSDLGSTQEILTATQAERTAAILLNECGTRLAAARRTADEAESELSVRERTLRHEAGQRRLPRLPDQLDLVERAVHTFSAAIHSLAERRKRMAGHQAVSQEQHERINRLTVECDEDAHNGELAKEGYAAELSDVESREELLGSDYETARAELEAARQKLAGLKIDRDNFARQAIEQHDTRIRAEQSCDHGLEALTTAITTLLDAAHQFGQITALELRAPVGVTEQTIWPAALPDSQQLIQALVETARDPSWTGTGINLLRGSIPATATVLIDAYQQATLTVAPATIDGIREATDQIWQAYRTLDEALKTGEDGYQVLFIAGPPVTVEVIASDGRHAIVPFAQQLREETGAQAILLDQRERGVLEDELLTSLAHEIHSRTVAARDLVKAMNADTISRPMSSGTAVGISWVTATRLDPLQTEVTRILGQDARFLGPQVLDQLRVAIRGLVRNHRLLHPRDAYSRVLNTVLDYRNWYTFQLQLRRPGQKPEQLTAKLHSSMSGGEKSASIHLPLFAAANAIYTSADPICPRMIALDEAFAGIDARYMPDLLALTVTFDLDLFMTGHDLWVRYPSVPMAAHYDLLHDEVSHTVSSLLMVWDGRQIIDAAAGFRGNDELASSLLGITPSRTMPNSLAQQALANSEPDEDEEDDDL